MKPAASSRRERVRAMLADLKMPGALEAVDDSLAIAAAESGRRVYYGTLAALIESLVAAKTAGNLARRLKVLTHPSLLVVDEIGYLPVTRKARSCSSS